MTNRLIQVSSAVALSGLSREDALRARQYPDQTQVLLWDTLDARLYAVHVSTPRPHWIVVGESVSDGLIAFALRVTDAIAGDEQSPLALIERLLQGFGMDIVAGNRQGKVVALATLPARVIPGKREFTFDYQMSSGPHERPDHRVKQHAIMQFDEPSQTVRVVLLFYLNETRYQAHLREMLPGILP